MNEPVPDEIRAAAGGDTAAFARLVRLYEADVWRFLRHLLGDGRLAEDVAQETFLRVFRGPGSFSFQSKFSTWVFSVARNAAVDALRAEARRRRLLEVLPGLSAVAPTAGTDALVEVWHATASLPRRLREALLAVEVLGLTYREAADVLGVPEGTVKSRGFHARLAMVRWFDSGERADEV